MQPGDFRDLMEGTKARIKRESGMHHSFRRLAFFSLMPHVKEGAAFTWNSFCREYWPMPDDEIESDKYEPEMDKELYEQMIKAHGLKMSKSRRKQDG